MRFLARALWLAAALQLAACTSHSPPRVVEGSLSGSGASAHTVVVGETLYAIALRYDKDFRELARLNNLDANFTIHPGQRLRLRESARVLARPASTVVKPAAKPAVAAKPAGSFTGNSASNSASSLASSSASSSAPKPAQKPAAVLAPVVKKPALVQEKPVISASAPPLTASFAWVWPVKGALISGFGAAGIRGKGLDIAGTQGDSVHAAAAGTVVYAGSGLVGYGRMLILRHDDNFISAYANNDRFLVKEGDRVAQGQAIASMGSSGTDRVKLHFEIRESGRPVDPLRYLPAK